MSCFRQRNGRFSEGGLTSATQDPHHPSFKLQRRPGQLHNERFSSQRAQTRPLRIVRPTEFTGSTPEDAVDAAFDLYLADPTGST